MENFDFYLYFITCFKPNQGPIPILNSINLTETLPEEL